MDKKDDFSLHRNEKNLFVGGKMRLPLVHVRGNLCGYMKTVCVYSIATTKAVVCIVVSGGAEVWRI